MYQGTSGEERQSPPQVEATPGSPAASASAQAAWRSSMPSACRGARLRGRAEATLAADSHACQQQPQVED